MTIPEWSCAQPGPEVPGALWNCGSHLQPNSSLPPSYNTVVSHASGLQHLPHQSWLPAEGLSMTSFICSVFLYRSEFCHGCRITLFFGGCGALDLVLPVMLSAVDIQNCNVLLCQSSRGGWHLRHQGLSHGFATAPRSMISVPVVMPYFITHYLLC